MMDIITGKTKPDEGVVLFDGVSLVSGFNVDVARLLDRFAPTAGAYNGLLTSASALNSPYASLSSGGAYIGVSLALAGGLHLDLGQASSAPGYNRYLLSPRLALAGLGGAGLPYDARSTNSLVAGVSWNFAKWGGFDFAASQTTEREGVLGENNAAIDQARTSALGFSAHVGFGGGWVTQASYSEGTTQLDLKPGAFSAGTESEMHVHSYGIAVAKRGLFGNDALGLAFSRPAPNYSSGAFRAGNASDMQFFNRDAGNGHRARLRHSLLRQFPRAAGQRLLSDQSRRPERHQRGLAAEPGEDQVLICDGGLDPALQRTKTRHSLCIFRGNRRWPGRNTFS